MNCLSTATCFSGAIPEMLMYVLGTIDCIGQDLFGAAWAGASDALRTGLHRVLDGVELISSLQAECTETSHA